ncbi:unnamed protein product [Porites lobata]|uniref:Uncharacterized protein n=1 Tax=Porites lobata TaxID=104759 RepID=A0ABN8NV40_9CNID|nr:unnamed protein product [Porites lobata]
MVRMTQNTKNPEGTAYDTAPTSELNTLDSDFNCTKRKSTMSVTTDRIGVSSLANKLHLASKNLQKTHLITVATGFGNTRAAKTHHTMRNSRRLARYKAHGFFLATHDTETRSLSMLGV